MTIDNAAAALAAEAQGRPTWPYEPLYLLLHGALQSYHMDSGILDVPTLAKEMSVTPESIYRWFRAGKISSANRARQLHTIILSEKNAQALAEAGREAPAIHDLYAFCN